MAVHPNSLANLKRRTANSGRKFYNGVVFRNCFTEEDVQELAQFYKDVYRDPEQKMSDRLTAGAVIMNYCVSLLEAAEQEAEQIKDMNDFKSTLQQLVAAASSMATPEQE